MGYASLHAQTAKKRPSTMAQDKTLGQGEGFSMGAEGQGEAIFQELFNEVQEAVSKVYLPGTMAYIRKQERVTFKAILFAEERLNELWVAMRKGEDTLERFKQTVNTWEDLHIKAGELYRERMNREREQKNLF